MKERNSIPLKKIYAFFGGDKKKRRSIDHVLAGRNRIPSGLLKLNGANGTGSLRKQLL